MEPTIPKRLVRGDIAMKYLLLQRILCYTKNEMININ